MEPANACPYCGAARLANAPAGLCPRCLLGHGLRAGGVAGPDQADGDSGEPKTTSSITPDAPACMVTVVMLFTRLLPCGLPFAPHERDDPPGQHLLDLAAGQLVTEHQLAISPQMARP